MGSFSFKEKTYQMDGKSARSVIREDLYIFCLACSKQVRDFIKQNYAKAVQ